MKSPEVTLCGYNPSINKEIIVCQSQIQNTSSLGLWPITMEVNNTTYTNMWLFMRKPDLMVTFEKLTELIKYENSRNKSWNKTALPQKHLILLSFHKRNTSPFIDIVQNWKLEMLLTRTVTLNQGNIVFKSITLDIKEESFLMTAVCAWH